MVTRTPRAVNANGLVECGLLMFHLGAPALSLLFRLPLTPVFRLPTPWWQQAPRLLCPHDNGPAELSHSAWGVEGKGLDGECGGCKRSVNGCGQVCFVAEKDNKMFHYLLCV
jgi:hypothetical protein